MNNKWPSSQATKGLKVPGSSPRKFHEPLVGLQIRPQWTKLTARTVESRVTIIGECWFVIFVVFGDSRRVLVA